MKKLNEVKTQVKNILIDKPKARGDDFLLVLEVYKLYGVDNYSISYVMQHHVLMGLPSFETITRCRRKVQAQNPELQGKVIREIRTEEEKKFKQFALEIGE